MLRKLEVDNFKTLNQFQMECSPLTVIVGNNASGKSTILQVLDLICSSVQEDFSSVLMRRGWKVSGFIPNADVEGMKKKCPISFHRFYEDFRRLYKALENEIHN